MRALDLPYPLLVGRVSGGRWSSQVPDRLEFEGRLGVRVDETVEEARAGLEAAVHAACPEAEIAWTGGQFAPGATPADHPFGVLVARGGRRGARGARRRSSASPTAATCGSSPPAGSRACMFGPRGLERAHAVDERVPVDDVVAVARTIARVLLRFEA